MWLLKVTTANRDEHTAPPHRAVRGHVNAMALYAGQSVGLVTEVKPAADIVDSLTRGAEDLLRAW